MILAYGQPRLSETGRPFITVALRLRHRETPQAQARGHAEERGGDEDPAVADPIEKLTGGERQPDAEHRTGHPDQAEGTTALGPRVDPLDDRRMGGCDGGAEEVPRDHETDERPRRADEGDQQEHASGEEGGPDEIRQRGPPVARLRPQEGQKQAPAPCGGHHGELKRRGAELTPENQPRNGPVRPAKTVNKSVAEISILRARRISGLNRDPI